MTRTLCRLLFVIPAVLVAPLALPAEAVQSLAEVWEWMASARIAELAAATNALTLVP
jgi:hypothetical protein